MPLGVFEIEVTKASKVSSAGAANAPRGRALLLLRVGSGADLVAQALSSLAGVDEGKGGIAAERARRKAAPLWGR